MWVHGKHKTFLGNRDGNVAISFAVGVSCLLVAVGAAVDISDLTRRKTSLQNATDMAVLAATVSGETKEKDLEAIAKAVFEQNFAFEDGEDLEVFSLKLLPENEVTLNTRLKKPAVLGGMIGKNELFASAEAATYLSSSQPLDVALVLDRTGSMAGPNMDALKRAANDYITDLENSGRDVRVSVVPFSDYVNVGVGNSTQEWLDLPTSGSGGSDVQCSMENISTSSCSSPSSPASTSPSSPTSGSPGSTCNIIVISSSGDVTTTPYTPSTSPSGSPLGSFDPCSVSVTTTGSGSFDWSDMMTTSSGTFCPINIDPQESSGNRVEECTPRMTGENWFGCVGSRVSPFSMEAIYNGQKIPPVFDRTCGQPLTELTSNLNGVKSDISDLTASGSTYIPAGLQWGWRTLDATAPFENASGSDRKKLLILMTDGENTRSQVGISHNGNDAAAANALTDSLCKAIKSSEIEIATISYSNNPGTSTSSTMLSDCASSADMYFDASNAKGLRDAFLNATNQVNEVRLIR